jgi:hypothetical protein
MDYAHNDRQALIAGDKIAPSNEEKLTHALRYLGSNHVLHRDYKSTPRHVNNGDWIRHSILRDIRIAASEAGRI